MEGNLDRYSERVQPIVLHSAAGPFQALLEKVDRAWDEMQGALAAAASASAETESDAGGGQEVTRQSRIARASALALCARDSGAGSDSAMTR